MRNNRLLKWLLAPFFLFGVDDDGGGAVDRGDDFKSSEEEDGTKAAEELAAKEAAEKAAADKAAEEKAATEAAEKEAAEKAAAAGKKDEKDDKKKDTRIPLSRHEEILRKEREARERVENELAKTRKDEVVGESNKAIQEAEGRLEGLEEKLDKAIIDGDTRAAKELRREIRTIEGLVSEQRVELRAAAATERAVEAIRYDTVVERIEAAYPQMVPGSDAYDKAAVAEVLEMKEAYELKNYSASAALQKAVKYVLGAESKKQTTATEVTPQVKEDDVATKVREERTESATKKALAASKNTPADTGSLGLEHDKAGGSHVVDAKVVMKMNQSDFAKLDEKTLAKLRGDDL